MIFIKHRQNRLEDLRKVDANLGVEIDIRHGIEPGTFRVAHDPWEEGPDLETWLKTFKDRDIRGPIILNTKDDGLEKHLIDYMNRHSIHRYIFLDTTIPTLTKWQGHAFKDHFFLRLSSYEPFSMIERWKKIFSNVWVDCFERKPLNEKILQDAEKHFQLCLVSPELHGGSVDEIPAFRTLASHCKMICTKFPEKWL